MDMAVSALPRRRFSIAGYDFLHLGGRRIFVRSPCLRKAVAYSSQGKLTRAAVPALSGEFALSDTPHVMGCVANPQALRCQPLGLRLSGAFLDYQISGPFISMAPDVQALTQGY